MPAPNDESQVAHTDVTTPNMARMWDYYLAGTDNSEADRQAARAVLGSTPDIPLTALENREFLRHAVRFLAEEAGVRQFIDIGSGLPTQNNIHQLVPKHAPAARVVYVDNDPVILARGRAHVRNVPSVAFIAGDLRCPGAILANQELRGLINFSEPVALCMTLVLHFISDAEDPYGVVAWLRSELSPGSYIVISHITRDDHDEEATQHVTASYSHESAALTLRSREQIEGFFSDLDLVGPGIVFLSQWRPVTGLHDQGGARWAYAGVGRKVARRGDADVIS